VGLGWTVGATCVTSLVVHRPRTGYTGRDRSAADRLDPVMCGAWITSIVLNLCLNFVWGTAACLAAVATCFAATRVLPYRSGEREFAHVCMHAFASLGTLRLVG